ncbi:MAG TPA: gliding motility protein GldN [Bacteroidia bacterium]|jgi:gliding motility associated protien GldN
MKHSMNVLLKRKITLQIKKLFSILVLALIAFSSSAQCKPKSSVKDPPIDPCKSERIARPFAISPAYVREADVMWSKRTWRVIDLREKLNLPMYYPEEPTVCLMSLFDVLKCALLNDNLVAFSNPIFDDEFTTPMTKDEVTGLLVSWDSTNQVEDVNNPGENITVPLKKEITAASIRQYWIKEDWFFNKERSVMEARIIGICPLAEKLSESGEVVGVRPLFWIYFPEARPFLAKAAVFNRHNDAERMSYDELFVKRMFASYVYKESNVYNRSISDYRTGLDILLESDEIKEEIFEYESDLWHY